MTRALSVSLLILLFPFSGRSHASTLVLDGRIENEVEVRQVRSFAVPAGGLEKLRFRFANPADTASNAYVQRISGRTVEYFPRPDSVEKETDAFGNSFTVVTWTGLRKNASVEETFRVRLDIKVKGLKSSAPFPLPLDNIPAEEARYLSPAPMVESDSSEVRALARRLTRGAATEQAAVTGILNWVVDNVKYRTPVREYGAVWTLKTREGNCQNLSHLSMALLRAAGVPARIVGGIALGRPWSVPLKDGTLLQSLGQGGHAWIEVWYPDIGWVPYDAQQSHLFVGPRHIKQTAGSNADDINDSWRAAPVLPRFNEDISAEYVTERVDLSLKDTVDAPGSFIMTSSVAKAAPAGAPFDRPDREVKQPPAPSAVEQPDSTTGKRVEIGNTDFPHVMRFDVSPDAGSGRKTFDKETAEFVTGEYAFAQAFTVESPVRVELVSLAMHKFGGRLGSLWIDVVRDEGGRPGTEGVRSLPLPLDTVKYYPGYRWYDFSFFGARGEGPLLAPGVWWIILRRSKDAIVNWFYTPGNRYGHEKDTRSTKSGIGWSYVLNADFNFRVTGFVPESP